MTVDNAIIRAYRKATRKSVSAVASIATAKYNALLGYADDWSKAWEAEAGTDWISRYEVVDHGAITATDTFDLDDSVRKLSLQQGDPVYIAALTGTQRYYYDLVRPDRLFVTDFDDEMPTLVGPNDVVARQGRTLRFRTAFTSASPQFGGTLFVPAYTYVDDITTGSQDIQVDDPMWLVCMMAAEYVRNDTVKQGQYGNLIDQANDRMAAMKADNGSQIEEVMNMTDNRFAGDTW